MIIIIHSEKLWIRVKIIYPRGNNWKIEQSVNIYDFPNNCLTFYIEVHHTESKVYKYKHK